MRARDRGGRQVLHGLRDGRLEGSGRGLALCGRCGRSLVPGGGIRRCFPGFERGAGFGCCHSTGDCNIRNVLRENREWYPEGHARPDSGMLLRMWDVGVDANGYAPVSLDEITAMMGIREAADEESLPGRAVST